MLRLLPGLRINAAAPTRQSGQDPIVVQVDVGRCANSAMASRLGDPDHCTASDSLGDLELVGLSNFVALRPVHLASVVASALSIRKRDGAPVTPAPRSQTHTAKWV
ncbi:MAG: hypothetical protein KF878_04505 [Planctomycetes bacterium]|nr:hypothetical protein [Planctomycetota bacterium]